jgi:hypothetical protein
MHSPLNVGCTKYAFTTCTDNLAINTIRIMTVGQQSQDFCPYKVLPYVPKIQQDSTLITHAHFCTLFRMTAVRVFWYRTNIFCIDVNCMKFNFQMFRDEVLYTILRQRPKRKFWLEHQTQNMFMLWLIGCDSCYHL